MAFNTRTDVIHKLLSSVSEASLPMGDDEDYEVEVTTRGSLVKQRFWTDGEQFFEVRFLKCLLGRMLRAPVCWMCQGARERP